MITKPYFEIATKQLIASSLLVITKPYFEAALVANRKKIRFRLVCYYFLSLSVSQLKTLEFSRVANDFGLKNHFLREKML